MHHIEIMLNDGMIGNKSILLALSYLTTGNLNSKLKKESTAYKMIDILPLAHEYIVPENDTRGKGRTSKQITSCLYGNVPRRTAKLLWIK
jgi:hypothetical protein